MDSSSPGTPHSTDGVVVRATTPAKCVSDITGPPSSRTAAGSAIIDMRPALKSLDGASSAWTPIADADRSFAVATVAPTTAEPADMLARKLSGSSRSSNFSCPPEYFHGRTSSSAADITRQDLPVGCLTVEQRTSRSATAGNDICHSRSGSDLNDTGKFTGSSACCHESCDEPGTASATASATEEDPSSDVQGTMPHRTPVILSGSIPQMVQPTVALNPQTYSPFSYGPLPNELPTAALVSYHLLIMKIMFIS